MGTRNLTIVSNSAGDIKVAQYGQWDGFPSVGGLNILRVISDADKLAQLSKTIEKVQLTDAGSAVFKDYNSRVSREETTSEDDYYFTNFASRDVGTKILQNIVDADMNRLPEEFEGVLYLVDSFDFLEDVSCEWAYWLDLKEQNLTVYKYGEPIAQFSLNNLPSEKELDFVENYSGDGVYRGRNSKDEVAMKSGEQNAENANRKSQNRQDGATGGYKTNLAVRRAADLYDDEDDEEENEGKVKYYKDDNIDYEDTWFFYVDTDHLEGIAIGGNEQYPTRIYTPLADEVEDIITANNVESSDERAAQLSKLLGEPYDVYEARGSVQREWQNIYYPTQKVSLDEIKELGDMYFGQYDVYINDEDYPEVRVMFNDTRDVEDVIEEETGLTKDQFFVEAKAERCGNRQIKSKGGKREHKRMGESHAGNVKATYEAINEMNGKSEYLGRGDMIADGGYTWEVVSVLATRNEGGKEIALVEALNADKGMSEFLVFVDGEVDWSDDSMEAAREWYEDFSVNDEYTYDGTWDDENEYYATSESVDDMIASRQYANVKKVNKINRMKEEKQKAGKNQRGKGMSRVRAADESDVYVWDGKSRVPDDVVTVKIQDGVTIIGKAAFSGCSRLTSIIIPDSVTGIGFAAFYYCIGLTSIIIPDSVTIIGNGAFAGCSGLTSVTIGDGVTSIGNYAFEGCSGLTSLTIPSRVQLIGKYAFTGCSNLSSVVIENTQITIKDFAFHNCPLDEESKQAVKMINRYAI